MCDCETCKCECCKKECVKEIKEKNTIIPIVYEECDNTDCQCSPCNCPDYCDC